MPRSGVEVVPRLTSIGLALLIRLAVCGGNSRGTTFMLEPHAENQPPKDES